MESACSKCNEPAVYFRRYTAEMLCRGCLVNTSLDRVRRTINKNQMFQDDDRIAVAISGGKDSAVLFDVLYRIETAYPQAEILPFLLCDVRDGPIKPAGSKSPARHRSWKPSRLLRPPPFEHARTKLNKIKESF